MTKKKSKMKIGVYAVAVLSVLSVFLSSGSMVVSALEVQKNETSSTENFGVTDPSNLYLEEQQKSELALEKIKDEYKDVQPKFDENGELIVTNEDELRIAQVVNDYLTLTGFSQRLRGVGKNWWNATGFVAGVIDAGWIVLGLGLANASANTVKAIIRNNKRNIARVAENVIVAQIGITTVRGKALAAIEIALALVGTSAGGIIAEGLDRVDEKNDNYLWA